MLNKIYCNIIYFFHPSKKRVVAFSSNHLQWLGINAGQLSRMLIKQGMNSFDFWDKNIVDKQSQDKLAWTPLLDDALRYAVCVECESIAPNVEYLFPEITTKWQKQLSLIYSTTRKKFKKFRPDLVIVVQGYEPLNAAARALAIELGIPILALENTALSERMLWDNVSGITTNRNLAWNYYWKYRHFTPPNILRRFHNNYLQSIYNHKSEEHSSPKASPDIPSNEHTVLFLGQVLTDSSMVFGLKGWSSPLEILKALATWCISNDHRLIIKLHPKETSGCDPIANRPYDRLTYRKIIADDQLNKQLDTMDALIDSDNIYDTYSLIKDCSFAVTVNSQSGLEAALFDKAVIVCGYSFYSSLGFTLDATDQELFPIQLDKAKRGWRPSNALEFAYIFFEHYCRDKTTNGLLKLINTDSRISV